MLETALLFVMAFGAFMLASRLFRKRGAGALRPSPLDTWIEAETARIVAAKLTLDEAQVSRSLQADPDPEIVSALERGTRKMEILFERVPGALGGHAADVTLEVAFEDATTVSARRRAPYAELPLSVRDELARSGTARVYRPYLFPWQR